MVCAVAIFLCSIPNRSCFGLAPLGTAPPPLNPITLAGGSASTSSPILASMFSSISPATRRGYRGFPKSFDKARRWIYHRGMGKAVKTSRKAGALNPHDIPNRDTLEAMASLDRGEGVVCKDADDLMKKLKT